MKRICTTLLIIFGVFPFVLSQSQELNTLYVTLIGPENVDRYYDDQVVYYQKYYNKLKIEVEDMIKEEESEEKKLKTKRKLRGKAKERLDRVIEQLTYLDSDLSFIEDFLGYWEEHKSNFYQKNKEFSNSFDKNKCYTIFVDEKKLASNKYKIEEEQLKEEVNWKEEILSNYKEERIETNPATTKWVKRKADKNCLSADPNDCLVWCLVEVPAEYATERVATCPEGFSISKDEYLCTNKCSVPSNHEGQRKIVITNKEYPSKEIRISNYTIIDCKN